MTLDFQSTINNWCIFYGGQLRSFSNSISYTLKNKCAMRNVSVMLENGPNIWGVIIFNVRLATDAAIVKTKVLDIQLLLGACMYIPLTFSRTSLDATLEFCWMFMSSSTGMLFSAKHW